jgi:peptide/nickel transport system permease protein
MKILIKLLKNPLSAIGMALLVFFIVIAILAPVLAPAPRPHEPYRIPRSGFKMEPKPPSEEHPFGTTEGQYDIYYAMIWGTRTAFHVGLTVTGLTLIIGILVGSIAAMAGGLLDEVMMRCVDIFMAFPFIVAAMVLATILGKGLDKAMIAMVAFGWMGYARLIRGDILAIREKEYCAAAAASGVGRARLLLRHILPYAIFPVLVQASMQVGSMVIWASTLSFLGVGAPEGYADWGQVISFSRNWIIGDLANPFEYWYTLLFPAGALILFVLSWNLVGDALRDILDPRLRGSGGH